MESRSRQDLQELVREQLQVLLEQKNFQGAKALLVPVQVADIAEAIEGLPEAMQAITGILLGTMLGIVIVWAFFLQGSWLVAIAVGISLFSICVLASISGSALPFLFRALRLDPALMSAPFITTAVDVLGVLIYLNVARWILQFS
jgi:Mg/Co/Ni transporter MgtE